MCLFDAMVIKFQHLVILKCFSVNLAFDQYFFNKLFLVKFIPIRFVL